jgi:hypothetical protein
MSASAWLSRTMPRERAKPAKERRVRSSPRKRPTARLSSSTLTLARRSRMVGAIGIVFSPMKADACRRSSAVAGRASEKPI